MNQLINFARIARQYFSEGTGDAASEEEYQPNPKLQALIEKTLKEREQLIKDRADIVQGYFNGRHHKFESVWFPEALTGCADYFKRATGYMYELIKKTENILTNWSPAQVQEHPIEYLLYFYFYVNFIEALNANPKAKKKLERLVNLPQSYKLFAAAQSTPFTEGKLNKDQKESELKLHYFDKNELDSLIKRGNSLKGHGYSESWTDSMKASYMCATLAKISYQTMFEDILSDTMNFIEKEIFPSLEGVKAEEQAEIDE